MRIKSLARVSRVTNIALGIFIGMFALVMMFIISTGTASARPHGITVGHHSKCHKKHSCRKRHHKHHPRCKKFVAENPWERITVVKCNGHERIYVEPLPNACTLEKAGSSSTCPPVEEGPICIMPAPGCPGGCYPAGSGPECKEEPFEAKDLEVYEIEGEKVTPAVWGSAEVFVPLGHEMSISFVAKYGSFESRVFSGPKTDPNRVYDKYEPPCSEDMPADGYDEAWVVVYDLTTQQYTKSEPVRFNIEEPENVHVLHPAW